MNLGEFEKAFENKKEQILEDYFTFLRFKSIATDPEYQADVEACAHWICDFLKETSLDIELWKTPKAPVLFAQNLSAGTHCKTLLFYCHYDVQPVDPLHEWISPPFEPTIRNGEVYARGASDDKGQCFYTLIALKEWLHQTQTLPVNIKLIIEGGEESGSVGLSHILSQKKEQLQADYLLIVDSGMDSLRKPAITLGARGILSMEVTLKEADFDLHSGMAGGIAYNPNRALVDLLSKLYTSQGAVAVPGFYEGITPISDEEKKSLSFEFDQTHFSTLFGFPPIPHEGDFHPLEATWLRPTLEINGIWGGYTGLGFKTVIPAKAHAKISCRLVPHQNPEEIAECVKRFILTNKPKRMEIQIQIHPGSGKAFRTSSKSPLAQLMSQSYTDVFHQPCRNILIGGSIPIAVDLSETAGAEMILCGLGLPDDHIHAPNEHFGLDRLKLGYLMICQTIALFPLIIVD